MSWCHRPPKQPRPMDQVLSAAGRGPRVDGLRLFPFTQRVLSSAQTRAAGGRLDRDAEPESRCPERMPAPNNSRGGSEKGRSRKAFVPASEERQGCWHGGRQGETGRDARERAVEFPWLALLLERPKDK